MSRYVRTFSVEDQAILNHAAFRPSARPLTKVEAGNPISTLWSNSGCMDWSFPNARRDLPRIRYEDVVAFREIWIRHGLQNINLVAPLRGYFTPARWDQYEGEYRAIILGYRTFKLLVYSETPVDAVEFSTVDVDQVLTSCLEGFQGDEMPACSGEWTRGAERVQWHVKPISRPDIGRMISSSRDQIFRDTRKELRQQCDIVLALRRFYRPVHDDGLSPAVLRENMAANAELDRILGTRLGLSLRMVRCLPTHDLPIGECAQAGVWELVGMFLASRNRMAALNCASFQLEECSDGDSLEDLSICRELVRVWQNDQRE